MSEIDPRELESLQYYDRSWTKGKHKDDLGSLCDCGNIKHKDDVQCWQCDELGLRELTEEHDQ